MPLALGLGLRHSVMAVNRILQVLRGGNGVWTSWDPARPGLAAPKGPGLVPRMNEWGPTQE